MDNYSLEEVKKIIEEERLTGDILHSIIESTTRKINLSNDYESLEILKYISDKAKIPDDVKEEISSYLEKYKSARVDDIKPFEVDNKKYFISIIVSLVVIVILLLIMYMRSK